MVIMSDLAVAVLDALKAKGLTLATVESCTGGMVAAALTDIPGSSAVVDRGFVTYSNAAKVEMVGVPMALIDAHGAVSPEVALAMAEGALSHSPADIAVAITGIAGPGGSDFKPEGLVCFCAASRTAPPITAVREYGPIGRANVRAESTAHALGMIKEIARR
jgi:nicotinamide-nucleotide amidase